MKRAVIAVDATEIRAAVVDGQHPDLSQRLGQGDHVAFADVLILNPDELRRSGLAGFERQVLQEQVHCR